MIKRPLLINFNLHTDGDLDFQNQLIGLMISNLEELQQALKLSLRECDLTQYRQTCHKVNSTLKILEDKEFDLIVEEIKTQSEDQDKISLFDRLCSQLIESLDSMQTRTPQSSY